MALVTKGFGSKLLVTKGFSSVSLTYTASQVSDAVWTATTRTLAAGSATVGSTAAQKTADAIWNYSTRTLTSAIATALVFTGPTSGTVNVASTSYTVSLFPSNGTVSSPVTVTPATNGSGTFSPATVSLTTASPLATFTYTPTTAGTYSLTITNNGSLTNASPISYVSSLAVPVATLVNLSGPTIGVIANSSTFTVALSPVGGTVPSTVVVTPASTQAGTLTPTSVNLTTGSPLATFTYTPSVSGTSSISITNNGSLANSSAISYVIQTLTIMLTPVSASSSQIVLLGNVTTGGTGPYTYQWYRSNDQGSTYSSIPGQTVATGATDTTVVRGNLYYYKLESTDTGTGVSIDSNIIQSLAVPASSATLLSSFQQNNEVNKFVQSTSVPGQVAIAIANPDGTSIAGGGGGSTTETYNTTAPTLTSGQTSPLQADVNGNLKVNVVAGGGAGGTSSSFNTTLPAIGTAVGFVDQTGKMQAATVASFHTGDNTSVSGTGLGLLTGGVTQIKNAQGNLDRQTEAGLDKISALGITTGVASYSVPFTVSIAQAITGSATAQVVTPGSMATIVLGTVINYDTANPTVTEPVVVTAFTATTFTAVFKNSHTATQTGTGFYYNQARDGAIGDSVPVTGLSAGMTYFINSVNGLAEQERSAAGELDGATGKGTAVAAEYEYNSGGPLNGSGTISNLNFDRARNIQGKGKGSGTFGATVAAGVSSITLTAAPTTLLAGQQIVLDRNTASAEAAYIGVTYVPGSLTIPLQSTTVFAHSITTSTIEWDQFAAQGPGTNGFLATGMGIEEEALYDPTSKQFFLAIGSGADNNAPTNTPLEVEGLYNGSTVDRARSVSGITDAYAGTGVGADAVMLWNGTNYDRLRGIGGAINVNMQPQAVSSLNTYRNINLNATGVNIKPTAGAMFGYYITNISASIRFVKIYNKATAPIVGTDIPYITMPLGAGITMNMRDGTGINLNNGIGIAATSLIADTDTTNPAANDVVVNIYYV